MSIEYREKMAVVATGAITMLGAAACTNANHDATPDGFTGGCDDGETIYVQNQFTPYGAKVRPQLDAQSQSAGLDVNEELRATGWFDTHSALYPNNPDGIKGETWFYVPELKAWVADAAVRGVTTSPAENDLAKYFTKNQAAEKREDCELEPK